MKKAHLGWCSRNLQGLINDSQIDLIYSSKAYLPNIYKYNRLLVSLNIEYLKI